MAPRHIRGEALCYLLDLCCVPLGKYNYTWNRHGPYSPSLLAQLRELDGKQEKIDNFYDEDLPDDVIFSDDHPKSLFWAMDRQCIDELLRLLDLPKDVRKAGEKIETLCSLLYISLDVMPGVLFKHCNGIDCARPEICGERHGTSD